MRYRSNHDNSKAKELKELKRDIRFKRTSGELPADIFVLKTECGSVFRLVLNKIAPEQICP